MVTGRTSLSAVAVLLALGAASPAQELPDVHDDFTFYSFPYSAEAAELFSTSGTRMLVAAFDRGWSLEKFVDETESSDVDALTILDELERASLVRGPNDFQLQPSLLLLRSEELEALAPALDADAAAVADLITERWDEVEAFVDSLEAGAEFAEGRRLYEAIVGGVLTGGMIDALREDQTVVPGPPRRVRGESGYYAWLVEGADPYPLVIRQGARVGDYTVFAVGPGIAANLRVPLSELDGPVYEAADAERWRLFSSLFARDHLFPYFRARRSALLELHREVRSSRYAAFAEFAAWYYHAMATRVAGILGEEGLIEPPASVYRYAIRTSR